jgi:hypothetical protein
MAFINANKFTEGWSIMLLKVLLTILIAKLTDKNKTKVKTQKKYHKQFMIKLFGKTRYYLNVWFGQWILFMWNTRDYDDVLYQKFYSDEKVAIRYMNRLQSKYTKVELIKVYDKHKQIGYMLYGKGQRIVQPKQPSNVINFAQYARAK